MMEKRIILVHQNKTDEEWYNNIKKQYKDDKAMMKPSTWKRLRLEQLKKEGKLWSK